VYNIDPIPPLFVHTPLSMPVRTLSEYFANNIGLLKLNCSEYVGFLNDEYLAYELTICDTIKNITFMTYVFCRMPDSVYFGVLPERCLLNTFTPLGSC